MTRQILLKTPRGNTAVVPVDHYLLRGSTTTGSSTDGGINPNNNNNTNLTTTKEGLLLQLIEASRRRDVGRKRTIEEEDCEEDIVDSFEDDDDDVDEEDGCSVCSSLDDYDDNNDNGDDDSMMDDIMLERDDLVPSESIDDDDDDEVMSSSSTTMTDDDGVGDVDDGPDDITVRMQSTSITSHHVVRPIVDVGCRRRRPAYPSFRRFDSSRSLTKAPIIPQVALYHQGRKVSLDRLWEWVTGTTDNTNHNTSNSTTTNTNHESSCRSGSASSTSMNGGTSSSDTTTTGTGQQPHLSPQFPLYLTLSTSVRLLGGIDRQNRVGSKFGGGGVSSSQQSERERKERLRQLALESIDLAKDPYLMRNHLGTYECKLCLTLHPNEANYLAHTQGRKHQQGLARRAHMEKLRTERQQQQDAAGGSAAAIGGKHSASSSLHQPPSKRIRIGRPAYQVYKSRDPDTQQRCLSFELIFPEIEDGLQPRHRFMSAFEQRVESPPDRRYQYLLFAADPYETVAFKIPNEPIDKEQGRFVTYWDVEEKKFTLTLYYVERDSTTTDDDKNKNSSNNGDRVEDTTIPVKFGMVGK